MKIYFLFVVLCNNYLETWCQHYPQHYFPRMHGPSAHVDFLSTKYPPLYPGPPPNFVPPFLGKLPKTPFPPTHGERYPIIPGGPPLPSFRTFSSNHSHGERDVRMISPFMMDQFPHDPCSTSSGDNGTCLSLPDCHMRGGISSDSCSNNYGVCCVFMATCGQSIRENGTYFVNNGYPSGFNGSVSCQVIIDKSSPNVCQYKLDFEQLTLAGPEPINHICNYDQFMVTGSNTIPVICGINTGNHMYIDAGPGASGPVVLTITTSGPELARYWKVKVTQITCPSYNRAEDGCLQYHTGVSGTLKSFNYEPSVGLHLSNQDYSICIRAERNFCSIQYSQCTDFANNRSHSFTLTGNTFAQSPVEARSGSKNCEKDWLIIPCSTNVNSVYLRSSNCEDRFCGGTFNTVDSTDQATIISKVKPFQLHFHTDSLEQPADMGNIGFCLNYVQIPCNTKS